jgi:hypothetical protein
MREKAEVTPFNMGICARVFAAVYWKINWLLKSGKDHIFLRLGLLRSPYSAQKNVAYARTLSAILPWRGFQGRRASVPA